MGQRGPKPTPTAKLAARGSWRAKVRNGEPQAEPVREVPAPPESLPGDAAAIWLVQAPKLVGLGVLTAADLGAFERYCRSYALWTRLAEKLQQAEEPDWRDVGALQKLDDMTRRLEAAFGMNPSDRSQLKVAEPRKDNGKAKFFSPKLAG